MKKSNALMISYMLFLSFALIADIFLSWPGLDRIAMASTIAGCFFAFADLSGWYGSVYTPKIDAVQKSIDYLPHYAHAYATLYETQKQQLQEIITIATPYADKNNLIVELIHHFTSHINQLEEMRQRAHLIEQGSPEEMNDPLNSARKTLKKYRLCEMILLIMGFVSFFMIIKYDWFVDLLYDHQSFATTLAFLIIMLTYYLRDILDERVKNDVNEILKEHAEQQNKVRDLIEQSKDTSLSDQLYDKISQLIELDKAMEATQNEQT